MQLILEDRPKEYKEYTPAVLVIVFFGVLSGAQNMGLTSPHLEAFAVARGSAAAIFQVLDRTPTIDSLSKDGKKLESVNGEIEFRDVRFSYPARKGVQVLQGLNLKINRGETVALVGGSGCGKSTCLQLIQRLYDPTDGQVRSDGDSSIERVRTSPRSGDSFVRSAEIRIVKLQNSLFNSLRLIRGRIKNFYGFYTRAQVYRALRGGQKLITARTAS